MLSSPIRLEIEWPRDDHCIQVAGWLAGWFTVTRDGFITLLI